MSIHDMKLFSVEDVRKAFDDAATRIIPLTQIPPQGRQEIREYFIDILFRRSLGDTSFPEQPHPIDITPEKCDNNIVEQEEEKEGE